VALGGADAGDLDPTFGDRGIVVTDFGAADEAYTVVVQRDGRVSSATSEPRPMSLSSDFAVARFLTR
jgi:hypothetical protein